VLNVFPVKSEDLLARLSLPEGECSLFCIAVAEVHKVPLHIKFVSVYKQILIAIGAVLVKVVC